MDPGHELGKLACYQATPHPLSSLIAKIKLILC